MHKPVNLTESLRKIIYFSAPKGYGKTAAGVQFIREGFEFGEKGLYVAFSKKDDSGFPFQDESVKSNERFLESDDKFRFVTLTVENKKAFMRSMQEIFDYVRLMGIRRLVVDGLDQASQTLSRKETAETISFMMKKIRETNLLSILLIADIADSKPTIREISIPA
jgi:KaiC/GvpD/RAD55 family RecA-like ATPase